jgi:hypothetical protein
MVAQGREYGRPAEDAWKRLVAQVVERLWAGTAVRVIMQELAKQGLGFGTARNLVRTLQDELLERGAL